MEYQKIINLLDTTFDNVPRFITEKWVEVYDQSGGSYNTYKQIRFIMIHILLPKELLLLQIQIMMHMIRN